MIKIAVDAMGSDNGFPIVVEAVKNASVNIVMNLESYDGKAVCRARGL